MRSNIFDKYVHPLKQNDYFQKKKKIGEEWNYHWKKWHWWLFYNSLQRDLNFVNWDYKVLTLEIMYMNSVIGIVLLLYSFFLFNYW
jgi:hypothetical protein